MILMIIINYKKKNRKTLKQRYTRVQKRIIFKGEARRAFFFKSHVMTRYPRVIKIKHAWRADASCWHANRPRVFEQWCRERARINRAIGKRARWRGSEEKMAARAAELKSLRVWWRVSYRAILPRTSSKRSSSSFRDILAFIPRAFFASNFPDVSLSRGRDRIIRRRVREEERGER